MAIGASLFHRRRGVVQKKPVTQPAQKAPAGKPQTPQAGQRGVLGGPVKVTPAAQRLFG